jgi:hypothetical protein
MGLPDTDEDLPSFRALKDRVRRFAATLPRPILLHDAVQRIAKELSEEEIGAIVNDVLTTWIVSETEPLEDSPAGDGPMLVGPAPASNDPAAWPDDPDMWLPAAGKKH